MLVFLVLFLFYFGLFCVFYLLFFTCVFCVFYRIKKKQKHKKHVLFYFIKKTNTKNTFFFMK